MFGGYASALTGTNAISGKIVNSKEFAAFTLKTQYRIREEKALGLIQRSVSELTVDKHKQMLKADKVENEEEKKDAVSTTLDRRQLNRVALVDDGNLQKSLNYLFDLRFHCTLHALTIPDYKFAANILALVRLVAAWTHGRHLLQRVCPQLSSTLVMMIFIATSELVKRLPQRVRWSANYRSRHTQHWCMFPHLRRFAILLDPVPKATG